MYESLFVSFKFEICFEKKKKVFFTIVMLSFAKILIISE